MFSSIIKFIKRHKIITIIVIVILAGGGYYFYQKIYSGTGVTRYNLAVVEKGTLTTTVSGTGQVSVSDQVDIKPKVSGDAIFVGAIQGQEVKAGTLLVQLDATDAFKSVRDAEVNLESAKLSLEKLKQPADQLSLLQAQNALIAAQEAKTNTQDDLAKSYESGFNTVANAFLNLPDIMTGLHDILYSTNFSTSQRNIDYYADAIQKYDAGVYKYRDDADSKYSAAQLAFNENFQDYKAASRFSDTGTIEALISQTYETTKSIAEAVKSANNLLQLYQNRLTEYGLKSQTLAATHLSSLNTYTGQTNTHLLSLLSIKTTIQNDKDGLISADRAIAEKSGSFDKLKAGPDALDIQTQELSIKQRENSLQDAREKLADYYIRAPFDGVLAKVDVQKGDEISSGTVLATLITKQRLAEITLNEIDAAKVKVGQKATLSFDAVSDLSLTGEVAGIDTIGTVSQGVVSYTIKINFDTQDERVKPGMSVSVSIILEAKTDVLMVPNVAVKTAQSNELGYLNVAPLPNAAVKEHYVQVLSEQDLVSLSNNLNNIILSQPPLRTNVGVGLSNDEFTEITSGLLKEGDRVITNVLSASSSASTTSSNSSFRIPGLTGGGGGFRGN